MIHENYLNQIRNNFNNQIQRLDEKLRDDILTVERTFPEKLGIKKTNCINIRIFRTQIYYELSVFYY